MTLFDRTVIHMQNLLLRFAHPLEKDLISDSPAHHPALKVIWEELK
jgi:hypothetical protein